MLRRLILPIEDLSGVLPDFLNRQNLTMGSHPVHLTIVHDFQTDIANGRILESMALICQNRLAFALKIGSPKIHSGSLVLTANSQQKWLVEIHQKLSKRCGIPANKDFMPEVRLVAVGFQEIDLKQELEKFPKSLHVNVHQLALVEVDLEGSRSMLEESHFRIAK